MTAIATELNIDLALYQRLGDRIREADAKEREARLEGLLGRWQVGRMVREERGDRGRLPNGRLEQIASALAVSTAELKNWTQFAAEYPTEDDVRGALTNYGSWSAICQRGLGSRGIAMSVEVREPEPVAIADLKPHQRNYRKHPPAQIEHMIASIREHGFINNVVIARDGTILVGHGIVEAARLSGMTDVPAVRLDVEPDDIDALKVMIGENELGNGANVDKLGLAGVLKELQDANDLLGAGYDQMQATAMMINAQPGYPEKCDADALWRPGMPSYERQPEPVRLILTFPSEAHREQYVAEHGVSVRKKESRTWSACWPDRPRARPRDLIWEDESGVSDKSGEAD